MNGYVALKKTDQEPEYQKAPNLPISSVGTANNLITKGNLPAGSALLTDTLDGEGNGSSTLNSKGITHIIHAAPKARSNFSSHEEFIACVVKSVQNSIILAERYNFEKLAVPLVGGAIFLGSCDPEKLTEGIIRGVANQLAECQKLKDVVLIDYGGNSQHLFLKKVRQLEKELFGNTSFFDEDNHFLGDLKNNKPKGIIVRVGDIRDEKLHKCNVIVNAANTYVGFGGGISGVISQQVGNAGKINAKASKLIGEFNSLISGDETNNDKKIEFVYIYCGRQTHSINNQMIHYSAFDPAGGGRNIEIVETHPIFANLKPKQHFVENKNIQKYKLRWKEVDKDKSKFEEGDFIEIEEVKSDGGNNQDQNDNGNGNNDDDNQNNDDSENQNDTNQNPDNWREILKKVDDSFTQTFNDTKVSEWQQAKDPFNTPKGVKNLLESIKENNDFLTEISSKHSTPSLNNLIADKSPQEVITIIKRFEYDQLNADDKKNKEMKIKKHYLLAENAVLTERQINDYLYQVATGEIDESSIKPNNNEQIKPQENTISKILSIGTLILVGGALLVLFFKLIKKRKSK